MNDQKAPDPRSGDPRIPDVLPILPLSDIVVYPMAVAPLAIPRGMASRLVDDVMSANRLMVLVGHTGDETPPASELPGTGTAVVIHQMMRAPDGALRLFVQGLERVRILEYTQIEPYLIGRIQPAPEQLMTGIEGEGHRRAVIDLFRRLVELNDNVPRDLADSVEALADPRQVAYFVASAVPFETKAKQEILELDQIDRKLSRLVELLQHEVAVREIGKKITSQTEERVSKGQREYILREQLRSIQRELGEDGGESEVDVRRRKIEEAGLPEEARREAERELDRLASIPDASPEHGIITTYLDWLASLPWSKTTGGEIDVKRAREILEEDHFGLGRIKQRITEYLAVRKLREERLAQQEKTEETGTELAEKENPAREPILCFVGPPGVGKTSLGISIARAMGRKFARISLGGIHDETEIRGHRRTYIGALPGRIIQTLKRVEAKDPVIMLDEMDKIGSDWRGDPSSALLEVLDPAQNNTFTDTYLGVPFDLSQVFFIATANTLETIPGPLLDRMEIVQLAGYTDDEKVAIAQNYLVPKQVKAHGLRPEEVSFEPAALRTIIRGYTREAGVRNLEREIANICRKVAIDVAEGRTEPAVVTPDAVMAYLERPRFIDEVRERTDRPGVATGLAWTPVGGDVLFVEAAMMPSKNENLILTGMLGDVMRESVQAAMSYVRSNATLFGIDPAIFDGKAIHVHVPAGAIPKDGPSAGVTMVTALVSLLTNQPVWSDVAMTGEITLRGKVLPIGGLKEKVLAAHRFGIKTVIVPKQNERDLDDVPAELRSQMEFVLADVVSDVVTRALDLPVAVNVGAGVS